MSLASLQRHVCSLTVRVADNAHSAGRVRELYVSSVSHGCGVTTMGVTAVVVGTAPWSVWFPAALFGGAAVRAGDALPVVVNGVHDVVLVVKKVVRVGGGELDEGRGWAVDEGLRSARSFGPARRERLREDQSRRTVMQQLADDATLYDTKRLRDLWEDGAPVPPSPPPSRPDPGTSVFVYAVEAEGDAAPPVASHPALPTPEVFGAATPPPSADWRTRFLPVRSAHALSDVEHVLARGERRAVAVVAFPFCSATPLLGPVLLPGLLGTSAGGGGLLTVDGCAPLPGTAGGVVVDVATQAVVGLLATGTTREVLMQKATAVGIGPWFGAPTAQPLPPALSEGDAGVDLRLAAAAQCVYCVKRACGSWGSAVSLGGGWFVTNAHVVLGEAPEAAAPSPEAATSRGKEKDVAISIRCGDKWRPATVIFASQGSWDVAVLRLAAGGAASDIPAMRFAEGGDSALGAPVAVVGYAHGTTSRTVTRGVVSGLLRADAGDPAATCVLTSATTAPGVSGGAMVDLATGACVALPTSCVYCPTLRRITPLGMGLPAALLAPVHRAVASYKSGDAAGGTAQLRGAYDVIDHNVDMVWQLSAADSAADALKRLKKQIAAVQAGRPTAPLPTGRPGAQLLNYIHDQRAKL